MPTLHQFDYIFAIAMIFAFLDAWNIGANDVANSFATSVSSRSLTMKQAMVLGSILEFAGAVGVGARVSDTIRNKILSTKAFELEPTLLMLGMTCALVGSSVYMTVATKIGLPVSTTHSIIGGVIGSGIAALGTSGVVWGWNGVAQVFAAWFIAPGIAGGFGAIIFLITKYGVMRSKNPALAALITIPFYVALTTGVLTMLIVWKGAASALPQVKKWGAPQLIGCIFGVGGGFALLSVLFVLPYLYRQIEMNDWELKWYHAFQGPLLLRRPTPPPVPEGHIFIQDYYSGHKTRAQLDSDGREISNPRTDIETNTENKEGKEIDAIASDRSSGDLSNHTTPAAPLPLDEALKGKWYEPKNWLSSLRYAFFHGVEVDVIAEQQRSSILAGDLQEIHARAEHYDNKAEHAYTFLQVLTACTASFVHGANDVSNAIGPLAGVYLVWSTARLSSRSPVPIWTLVYGGAAISIGLWTYGYNIMRNLGNRLTLHSPSRGFSMELGSAMTIVMATRLALPVSTTQCIVGATVGVGLCNGDWRSINWRMVAWCYMGWFITLPVTGIISGCLMGIIINAPQWGNHLNDAARLVKAA